jgi:hypothetical protein
MGGGTAQARSSLVAQVEARQQVNDTSNAVTINLKPYVSLAVFLRAGRFAQIRPGVRVEVA